MAASVTGALAEALPAQAAMLPAQARRLRLQGELLPAKGPMLQTKGPMLQAQMLQALQQLSTACAQAGFGGEDLGRDRLVSARDLHHRGRHACPVERP